MDILFWIIRIFYALIGILAIVNVSRLRKKTKCEGDCYKGAIIAVMVCITAVIFPEYITAALMALGTINRFITKKAKVKGATNNVEERKITSIHERKKERQKKQTKTR